MFGRDRVIQNVRTEGYLDGGSNHMRPKEHSTDNSGWITWRIIPQDEGTFFIQNVDQANEVILRIQVQHFDTRS